MELYVQNVNYALPAGLSALFTHGIVEPSRNGDVYVLPMPHVTIYGNPQECVLFNAIRDANPFFHLVEAIWMLHGRDDVSFLTPYVKSFKSYAEASGIIHGAYGARWRAAMGFDQLGEVIRRLDFDHTTRQAVLQMWDARHGESDDLKGDWHDRPCNTHVYFRIRTDGLGEQPVLDITTVSRSHDVIWGAYGANAVHFAVLQAYVAERLDVGCGRHIQFSNNFHAYTTFVDQLMGRAKVSETHELTEALAPPIEHTLPYPSNLSETPRKFLTDGDIEALDLALEQLHDPRRSPTRVENTEYRGVFAQTVFHAAVAHRHYRDKANEDAIAEARKIPMLDWRIACVEWLERRTKT